VQGNGVYGEENRTPSTTFTGVHAQGGVQATVTSGAARPKVIVSGDANLVPYIETRVVTEDGDRQVLHVRVDVPGGSWSSTIPPRVVVDLAELEYAHAAGDSHLSASGVATQHLSIEAHGKSDVLVMGPGGGRIQVVASDAAVDAGAYPVSEGAQVELSSGARAELRSDGPVAGAVRAGCRLENLGSGRCAAVLVPAGETPPPTILCPVP
jgi:hypothetical protein